MNLDDFLRRLRNTNATPVSPFSKLMLNTTLNLFVAIVVFIVASYLLLPRLMHQEFELQRLRLELDRLNGVLNQQQMAEEETPERNANDGSEEMGKGD
jgi:hypothetical protein